MEISVIVLLIVWFSLSMFLSIQYLPFYAELTKTQIIIVFIILLIFGPFLIISSICEFLLDQIFPDGWNSDDDDFKGA